VNGGGDLVLVGLKLGVEGGVEDGACEGLVVGASGCRGGCCVSDCGAHGDHVLG